MATVPRLFIRRTHAPCRICAERFAGCHAVCKKYNEWKSYNTKEYYKMKEQYMKECRVNEYEIKEKIKNKGR